jgi:uncharacterized membrane protein
MDFGLPFSFVFKDQDWLKKCAITGLITLIPLVGQFYLIGWMLEIAQQVMHGYREPKLPDLDFGRFLGTGFKVFVVNLVYAIPIFIIYIPAVLLSAVAGNADSSSSVTTVLSVVMICVAVLVMLYSLVLALVLPAAMANVAAQNTIGAGLQFGRVLGLVKANFVAWLLVIVGSMIGGMIGSAGSLICGVGMLLTLPYSVAIYGHFIGQAYRLSTNQGAPTY